jgi:hypothetical protein
VAEAVLLAISGRLLCSHDVAAAEVLLVPGAGLRAPRLVRLADTTLLLTPRVIALAAADTLEAHPSLALRVAVLLGTTFRRQAVAAVTSRRTAASKVLTPAPRKESSVLLRQQNLVCPEVSLKSLLARTYEETSGTYLATNSRLDCVYLWPSMRVVCLSVLYPAGTCLLDLLHCVCAEI